MTARVKRYLRLARAAVAGFRDPLVEEEMDRLKQAMNPDELGRIQHEEPTRSVSIDALCSQGRFQQV